MKNEIIKSDLKTLLKRYKKSEAIINLSRNYDRDSIMRINPFIIRNSKYLFLKNYSEEYLEKQKKIVQSGTYEPLIVREIGFNDYEVIIGRSFLKVAQELKLDYVRCIVYAFNDEETLLVNLSYLRERKNSNVIEEAILCSHLKKDFGYKNKDLAEFLMISEGQISNMLNILKLKEEYLSLILDGKISYGHAKAFSRIETDKIDFVIEAILKENLSVRETEILVRSLQSNNDNSGKIIVNKNRITLTFANEDAKNKALKKIERFISRGRIKL